MAQALGHPVQGWALCFLPGSRLPPQMELRNPAKFSLQPSHSNLLAFVYSAITYRCPLGILVALETESHSRLETRRPRTNCTMSTRYNCKCSGSSPICSGALETLNYTPSPTSTCWKTCFQLSGALRKNFPTSPGLQDGSVRSLPTCPATSPSIPLTPIQQHWPSLCSSNILTFQPQDLCTGFSLV